MARHRTVPSASVVHSIVCRRRLLPKIIIIKRGRDNLAPWTYTLFEISSFLDIIELVVPSDMLGWEDVASIYNANASVQRQRSILHLTHLFSWVYYLLRLSHHYFADRLVCQ